MATGINNTAEYMASGLPFAKEVTAGNVVDFPFVTNEIYISNPTGADVFVAFSSTGIASGNKFCIPKNSSFKLRMRITKLYTNGAGSIYVAAGLTQIPAYQFPTLVAAPEVVYDPSSNVNEYKYPGI